MKTFREDWTVDTPVAKVFAAAQAKHAFFTKRVKVWLAKFEKVEKQIRTSGLKFAGHVEVDRALSTELRTCYERMRANRDQEEAYGMWVAFLNHKKGSIPLNCDDWHMFFGKAIEPVAGFSAFPQCYPYAYSSPLPDMNDPTINAALQDRLEA